MRSMIGVALGLALLAFPASSQSRLERSNAKALDQTAPLTADPNFGGAAMPDLGPQGYALPATPPMPSYGGEWVYYLAQGLEILPQAIIRHPAVLTCVNGDCDPAANLPYNCTIDRLFLGTFWIGSTCPRRVLNNVGWPSYP